MKIEVIKENRKSVVLKVESSDRAILKCPKSYSAKKIEQFVSSKKSWLEKASKAMLEKENMSNLFDLKNFGYINGVKSQSFNDVVIGFEKLSESGKASVRRKFYLSMFSLISDRVKRLSESSGLKFCEVKAINSVRLWGSFNSKGVMKLNYKLIILPERLWEYVIVHELCHSKHMNHKSQFWNAVGKILPDFKSRKKELEKFSFLLKSRII